MLIALAPLRLSCQPHPHTVCNNGSYTYVPREKAQRSEEKLPSQYHNPPTLIPPVMRSLVGFSVLDTLAEQRLGSGLQAHMLRCVRAVLLRTRMDRSHPGVATFSRLSCLRKVTSAVGVCGSVLLLSSAHGGFRQVGFQRNGTTRVSFGDHALRPYQVIQSQEKGSTFSAETHSCCSLWLPYVRLGPGDYALHPGLCGQRTVPIEEPDARSHHLASMRF